VSLWFGKKEENWIDADFDILIEEENVEWKSVKKLRYWIEVHGYGLIKVRMLNWGIHVGLWSDKRRECWIKA
jgi:hypothetical protein